MWSPGLRGNVDPSEVPHYSPAADTRPHHEDSRFRYCTNFIVTGSGLDSRSFVPMLEELGDSVLVVGDEATLKVHVHTDEPDAAVALFERAGEVTQLDVGDMREQIAERSARLQAGAARRWPWLRARDAGALRGVGAFVVDGGETFNPSIYDLLAAIHEVHSEEVLVFPNNPNVVMAAERAAELSDKQARVVGCTSQQAGVAALVELDPTASIADNAERMATRSPGSAPDQSRPPPGTTQRDGSSPATRSASSGTRSSAGAGRARPSARRWRGSPTAPRFSPWSAGRGPRSGLRTWRDTRPRAWSWSSTRAASRTTGGARRSSEHLLDEAYRCSGRGDVVGGG